MVEDFGSGVEDGFQAVALGVEVGDEDLDDHLRVHGADGLDGAGEVERAAVLEVVAGDGGDDDVLEAHPADGLGDALGFVVLQGEGLGRADRAEAAGARAAVARDHEGGRALAPAFQRFGHWADSQTVWSLRSLTSALVEKKTGLEGSRTLIQSGFFSTCREGSIFAQDMAGGSMHGAGAEGKWGRCPALRCAYGALRVAKTYAGCGRNSPQRHGGHRDQRRR